MAANSSRNPSYDVAPHQDGDYPVSHGQTDKRVKLLCSKSKVYVHPSSSSKDNIPGFIALMQQQNSTASSSSRDTTGGNISSFILGWVPESSLGFGDLSVYARVDLSDNSAIESTSSCLVSPPPAISAGSVVPGPFAFGVSLDQVYSLLVRPPNHGWYFGSIVINTRYGESYPALFFHDSECESTTQQKKKQMREHYDPFGEDGTMYWGGDDVLQWLRRYVILQRSQADSKVYLVDPSTDDQLSFVAQARSSKPSENQNEYGTALVDPDANADPITKLFKETRWKVLEKLSRITTFTRRAAGDITEHPNMPPQVRRLLKSQEVQTLQNEFDSARIYLARWAMGVSEHSERDKERNQRIDAAKHYLEQEETDVGNFELLNLGIDGRELHSNRNHVTLEEWKGWFDLQGYLKITSNEVKARIFHGGLNPSDGVRREAWPFLLNVYPWDSGTDDRRAIESSRRDEYLRLKASWWDRLIDENSTPEELAFWREERFRIEKDVHRTDRYIPLFAGEDIPHPDPDSPFADTGTNVHMEQLKDMLLTFDAYNRELGYVQGMSDLLAPIYAVLQDDAIAFWAFVSFMERMERNFLRDQSGMHDQLTTIDQLSQLMDPDLHLHLEKLESTNFFFFFRMLIVWFKREFEWSDLLRLWEVLWTDFLSSSFHMFITLAILEKHRDPILNHLQHADELLKYMNDLSGTIELESVLVTAESLFHRFRRTVQAIDSKTMGSNLPDLPLRQRLSTPSPSSAASSSALEGASSPVHGGRTTTAPVEDNSRIITPQLRTLLSKKIPGLQTHKNQSTEDASPT